MTKVSLLILFFATSFFAIGQVPIIKKKTAIIFDRSDVIYGGHVKIDTCITEYYKDGTPILKDTNVYGYFSYLNKSIIIDSVENFVHKREFWSDSSVYDIFYKKYHDTLVTISLKKTDTIQVQIEIYRNKKLLSKTTIHDDSKKTVLYNRNNRFFTKTTTAFSDLTTGKSHSMKYSHNNLFFIDKNYEYNTEKQEWYTKSKEKFYFNGYTKKLVYRKYNEYYKHYYIETVKYKYNSYHQISVEKSRGVYRTIEKKIIYLYEYY
jgi:hypothetical protein